MCLGMFMAILDIQVVVTSMPAIQSALAIPPERISWIQTSYLIAEIIAIPLTGVLTRALSLRGLFTLAVALFGAASLGCALSAGFADLVAWRLLQGFAGGLLIPLVFTAVFLLFPERQQGLATTIAGVLAVLAPTVGPLVGGWITQAWSWHWLFLVNVVPALLVAAITFVLLPRHPADMHRLRMIDMPSLLLMALALAVLEIGLKQAPETGWTSGTVLGLFLLSALCAAAFIHRTLGRDRPLVRLGLFGDRSFAVACWLSFTFGAGLYGSVYLMPVFLGYVGGQGPLEIGATMLVTGVVQLVVAPVAVALERRIDARLLSAGGFVVFGIGLAMSAFATPQTGFAGMFWPQVVRGAGAMFCLLPPTRLALGRLAPERVADGSGLFNLMRNLGGAIGIALADTVIYCRAAFHAEALGQALLTGSRETAAFVGLPLKFFHDKPLENVDPGAMAFARPLVEKAGLTLAVNEAWLLLALFMLLGLASLPLLWSGARHSR
jgi:DHA2 family multidrug resistance protein